MAFVSGPALPTCRASTTNNTCVVRMQQHDDQKTSVTRRQLLTTTLAAAAAALVSSGKVLAEREYPNVGFLGGGETIDVNNANVRSYLKIKGFYPSLAGLIVSNGPYESVDDLYNIPGITDVQKDLLDQNKEKLVVLAPAAEYEIDKINNGLYR